MFDLTGRTALVTGAGQGVGFGIAERLIAAGANVLVNDLVEERAGEAARSLGTSATPLPFDVTDLEAVETALSGAASVDILINNAGVPEQMQPTPFREMDPAEWSRYLDLNIAGVLNCTKTMIDGMCERGWGRVITISSGAGTHGIAFGISLYGAGKGGSISFMRHLALETAAHGVTANTLSLGLMQRPTEPDFTSAIARSIPVGRTGTGTDVGNACIWLASDEAAWMTGQTIGLNGGSITS